METKEFILEGIKADDSSRTVEGWASIFDFTDSQHDIVVRGAFAKSLKKSKPVMLWQHNSRDVIGTWDEVEEQDRGLWVKGTLLDTTLGSDVYKMMKAGAVKSMSIGYTPKRHEYDREKNVRKLMEVELHEVSIVTFPANERAKVTRVKSVGGMTEREFEEYLRDGGLSEEAAKIVIAKGFKALGNQRDAEVDALENLTNIFNQIKGMTS